jgi:1-acyl-sn-glycerol-3-phosphate acyltransferase
MGAVELWLRVLGGLTYLGVMTSLFMVFLIPFIPFRQTRIRIGNFYGTVVGNGVVWFSGSRVIVNRYDEIVSQGPAIYIANHVTPLDVFTGIWMSPPGCCGIAKKEIIYYPFFGQMYWLAGHLRIDRSSRERAVASLQALGPFVMKHGLSIWIWPEGHRSRTGRLMPFKKGVAHLAIATGLPIVPIVIHGAHRAWDNGGLRLRATTMRIDFHDRVDTSDWQTERIEDHLRELEQVYVDALADDQKPLVWERGEAQRQNASSET